MEDLMINNETEWYHMWPKQFDWWDIQAQNDNSGTTKNKKVILPLVAFPTQVYVDR